jgi:hypothetical protein
MSMGPAPKNSIFGKPNEQMNLLERFQPKGFTRLREAIEQLGAALIPDWNGE